MTRKISSARRAILIPGAAARAAGIRQDKARLASLPGVVPGKYDRPNGCLLNPRCPYATDKCRSEEPALADLTGGRQSKCHYPLDDAGRLDYEYAKGRHATTAVAGH